MLMRDAKEHARRESATAVRLHHVLLAYADRDDTPAGRILHEAGWRAPQELSTTTKGEGGNPRRLAHDLVLNLAWVNGLRVALPQPSDFGVCFLLSCVLGPSSSAHAWLGRHGVDLDRLCVLSSATIGLPDSACIHRTRWATEPVIVPSEDAAEIMRDLRSRGLLYQFNTFPDGTTLIVPEESSGSLNSPQPE
ncbi:hypothetical protein [Pseudofrankia sp. BMG5.36]|uniref:hypothetical protein n=1 Tax=Pseudofrankia sp. BMG5.36 TaxID=1834512 RepID=UPI00092398FC|nr:hypothetical protein [Pseudofrankia sp. BMG5.36]OHV63442.1 hypothetical protein BCD48_38130 [Pseudofrankia sp. BMG5.36]